MKYLFECTIQAGVVMTAGTLLIWFVRENWRFIVEQKNEHDKGKKGVRD